MKFKIGIIILAIGFLSSGISSQSSKALAQRAHAAHDSNMPCDFFPPNNLKFPVRVGPTQMPEHTFRRIVQVINQIYAPLFRQAGHPPLYISPRWTTDEVNAFATICNQPEHIGQQGYPPECAKMQTSPGVYTPFSLVVMFGGLARHPLMTSEGFVLVACHEIGHHLGGFPRYGKNAEWPSTEGQSDYFATSKCARKIFQNIGQNAQWAERARVNFDVRRSCMASFPNSAEDAAICMRSAMGGLSLARTLSSLSDPDLSKVQFTKPDKSVVTETFEGHPQAQCRLDTYLAGSVCRIPDTVDFGMKDSRTGACRPDRIEHAGARPACWFKDL